MAKTVYNPLAPLSQKQLLTQALAMINSIFGPQFKNINSQYSTRVGQGSRAIDSVAGDYNRNLLDMTQHMGGIYGNAASQLAGISENLGNSQAAQGQQLGSELSSKLAAIAPPTSPGPSMLAGLGATAAGNLRADAGANQASLVQQGSGAAAYGAQLPAIARLAAIKSKRQLVQQAEADRAQATGSLQAQVPGQVQSLLGQLTQNETTKAIANQTYGLNLQKANTAYTASLPRADEIAKNWATATKYKVTGVDDAGMPIYARGKDGKPLPLTPGKTASSKSTAQAALARLQQKDFNTIVTIAQGYKNPKGADPLTEAAAALTGAKLPDAAKAKTSQEAYQAVSAWLAGRGYRKALDPVTFRNQAVNILRAAGYRDFSYLKKP